MDSEIWSLPIFDRLILAGGPARSGTTLLAKLLNGHPQIVTAIDNPAYECWGLYYYLLEVGLVRDLREGPLTSQEVKQRLAAHLIRDGWVCGIAPSDSVMDYPFADPPARPMPDGAVPWYMDYNALVKPRAPRPRPDPLMRRLPAILVRSIKSPTWFAQRLAAVARPSPVQRSFQESRRRVPLSRFRSGWRLCLKSPEITFALPQLANALGDAKFVLVHRPIVEIAESMYRVAKRWVLPSYHRRWRHMTDAQGRFIPPPGIPVEWDEIWQQCTDFQMCALHAASYARAMALNIPQLPAERVFVYDHTTLRAQPQAVLGRLAEFLEVDPAGFESVSQMIKRETPAIDSEWQAEYDAIAGRTECQRWSAEVTRLNTI
jgi:hypothetical protein